MHSIFFLQSCSFPAISFSKHFLMAYSPAFVLPLPFPQIFSLPQHCNRRLCMFGKQGILSKTSKRKGHKNISFPKTPKNQNYLEKAKPETKEFNHKSCC